jgi:leucyl-tRNA synthetase
MGMEAATAPAPQMRRQFPYSEFEPKWQRHWEDHRTFRAANPGEPGSEKPKVYILDMFPYPSGDGLHVGHPEGYTATDILARYKRMNGFNVLHPMGWDSFGLPAENHAVKTGTHPAVTTATCIANFTRQIKSLGFSYDWDREIATSDPKYYRWTQWIFLKIYDSWFDETAHKARPVSELAIPAEVRAKGEEATRDYVDARRLAYVAEQPVNWSPELGTVLANEEVEEWREKGYTVERRPMRQWMLRITAYAQRLLEEIEPLQWTESIKEMQRDWIGRSQGARVTFAVQGHPARKIEIFTTRPDTLFGATYLVLAPEHPFVEAITAPGQREAVEAYRHQVAAKSDLERTGLAKVKTGVPTGALAVNPVNGAALPIWIADYVLMGYGTGAIMAVPAHDERDHEFAGQFGLPILEVVRPMDGRASAGPSCFSGDGVNVHSGFLDGLPTGKAQAKVTAWLEEKGLGRGHVQYKLRDWLFARQRYWGEPFPIVWKGARHFALPESDLPIVAPDLTDYKPAGDGRPPLAKAEDWVRQADGSRRETNTMPQWAGSCWYYLRYLDPRNEKEFVDPKIERYWMGPNGVDLYVGGAEHAVLHLLYARFWHKVLFDLGYVSTPEPFHRLVNQGIILGEMEFTAEVDPETWKKHADSFDATPLVKEDGSYRLKVKGDKVEKKGDRFVLARTDIAVEARAYKMSKSRGNVINPDHVVRDYGADSLRLFEMFMGPLEQVKPWSMTGVEGVHRFLGRVWRLVMEEDQAGQWVLSSRLTAAPLQDGQLRSLHAAIKKVTHDIEALAFNTAISALMVLVNDLTKEEHRPRAAIETLLLLLAPFAPHIAEELWWRLGHAQTLAYERWPAWDERYLTVDSITVVVQVNGKVRTRVEVAADAGETTIKAAAQSAASEWIAGHEITKVVSVPGKLINFVIRGG